LQKITADEFAKVELSVVLFEGYQEVDTPVGADRLVQFSSLKLEIEDVGISKRAESITYKTYTEEKSIRELKVDRTLLDFSDTKQSATITASGAIPALWVTNDDANVKELVEHLNKELLYCTHLPQKFYEGDIKGIFKRRELLSIVDLSAASIPVSWNYDFYESIANAIKYQQLWTSTVAYTSKKYATQENGRELEFVNDEIPPFIDNTLKDFLPMPHPEELSGSGFWEGNLVIDKTVSGAVNFIDSAGLVTDYIRPEGSGFFLKADSGEEELIATNKNAWMLNGNTIGAKKTIGSLDAYDVGIIRGGTEIVTILSTGATITGKITSTSDSEFNGVLIGRGGGSISTNTRAGAGALVNNTTGSYNTALGTNALNLNTTGAYSLALGANALASNTTGNSNVAIGGWALFSNLTGSDSLALGVNAGRWYGASVALTVATQSIFLGSSSKASGNSETNQIVIGYAAIGEGSNSVVLGNNSITKTILKGNVGIGITSPTYKLDVSGTFHTTGAATFDVVPSSLQDGTTSNHLIRYSQFIANVFLKPYLGTVKTVALTNITLEDPQTISGYAAVATDIVLVIGQTDATKNGLWTVASGAWTRPTDANEDAELRGFIVSITSGTYAGYKYNNTNASAITIDATNITYSEWNNTVETDPIFVAWRDETRTANTIFMAPNGSNAAATWRLLVAADIPSLDFSKITTGFPTTIASAGFTDYNSLWDTRLAATVVPIANGGTGSATQNFVDLTTAQTIAGIKTFSVDAVINGLTVGKGGGSISTNAAFGYQSLYDNTTGINNSAYGGLSLSYNTTGGSNTASGYRSLYANNIGSDNTAVGTLSLHSNTTGGQNTAVGSLSLQSNITGSKNTAFGQWSGYDTTGSNNTFLGYYAGGGITTGSGNTILGYNIIGLSATLADTLIIGAGGRKDLYGTATGIGIGVALPAEKLDLLGNFKYSGTLKPSGTAGTAGQFLGTDGTNDTWATLVAADISDFATAWTTNYNLITKNTGYNKAFGTSAGTVSEGNHTHDTATASVLGFIKIGTTLEIAAGVVNQKSGIVTASTYRSVTVDTYGRVTGGTNPTTIAGYGITDYNSLWDTRLATKTTANLAENASYLYFTNARGIAATLSGYSSGAGTISSSDTILSAINKLNGNVAALSGGGVGTIDAVLAAGNVATSKYITFLNDGQIDLIAVKNVANTVSRGSVTLLVSAAGFHNSDRISLVNQQGAIEFGLRADGQSIRGHYGTNNYIKEDYGSGAISQKYYIGGVYKGALSAFVDGGSVNMALSASDALYLQSETSSVHALSAYGMILKSGTTTASPIHINSTLGGQTVDSNVYIGRSAGTDYIYLNGVKYNFYSGLTFSNGDQLVLQYDSFNSAFFTKKLATPLA
jgi:hypothetical protein